MSTELATEATSTTESPQSPKYFTDWSSHSMKKESTNEEIVEVHGNKIYQPDTNNATCIRHDLIRPEDGLSKSYWRKLSGYNSGIRNLDWSNERYFTYIDNTNRVNALLCQLDINERHRGEIRTLIMRINFGKVGIKIEKAMFCAIAAHVHMTDSIGREYHPQQKRKDQDALFAKMKEEVRLTEKEVNSLFAKFTPKNRAKYLSPADGSREFGKFERNKFKSGINR